MKIHKPFPFKILLPLALIVLAVLSNHIVSGQTSSEIDDHASLPLRSGQVIEQAQTISTNETYTSKAIYLNEEDTIQSFYDAGLTELQVNLFLEMNELAGKEGLTDAEREQIEQEYMDKIGIGSSSIMSDMTHRSSGGSEDSSRNIYSSCAVGAFGRYNYGAGVTGATRNEWFYLSGAGSIYYSGTCGSGSCYINNLTYILM